MIPDENWDLYKRMKNTEKDINIKYFFLILNFFRGSGQAGRVEDPELTSSHGHTKITTIYRTTIDEKDQKTSRKDLLQLKI